MKKMLFTSIFLLLIPTTASADQITAASPIKHLTFQYEDSNWESRIDAKFPPSYAIRMRDSGVVMAILELMTPKGSTSSKLLDKVQSKLSLDFEMTKSNELDAIKVPADWECRSFGMSRPVDGTSFLTMECIFLGAAYHERLTIIVPNDLTEESAVEINKVIASITNV